MRILALNIGDNLIWYGTLCINILIAFIFQGYMHIASSIGTILYNISLPCQGVSAFYFRKFFFQIFRILCSYFLNFLRQKRRKWTNERNWKRKMKERIKKGEKIGIKSIFCVKNYFFFKLKENWVLSEISFFGNFYFYPVLWNDRV